MRIGVGRYMQNDSNNHGSATPDHRIYDEEIALASLAEPLGFDSIWTTSHYFSPYQMTGSALQQATFMAGRTSRVDFGTMVVVLPWHHPLHIATDICVLDNMLAGRRLILGLGRGSFRLEFDALGIPIDESLARFKESVEIIRLAIAEERFSYRGTFYTIEDMSVRPRPRNPEQLLDDMRVVWSDVTNPPFGATELGLDVLLFAARGARTYQTALRRLDAIREEKNYPPCRPVLTMLAACTSTDAEGRSVIERHASEFMTSSERLSAAPTHGARLRRVLRRLAGATGFNRTTALQLWGSPARCIARLRELDRNARPREVVVAFRYGAMPHGIAEKSMRLFAQEVLPVVHSWSS